MSFIFSIESSTLNTKQTISAIKYRHVYDHIAFVSVEGNHRSTAESTRRDWGRAAAATVFPFHCLWTKCQSRKASASFLVNFPIALLTFFRAIGDNTTPTALKLVLKSSSYSANCANSSAILALSSLLFHLLQALTRNPL